MTTPACGQLRELLAPLLAGEIEPESRREVETHLAACRACSAEAEEIRLALSLLKTEEPPDPGAPYWSSFGGRLRTRIAFSEKRRRTRRLAALAAAAAIVAALALGRLRHEGPPIRIAEGPAAGATPAAIESPPAPSTAPMAPAGRPLPHGPAPARAPSVAEAEAHLDALIRQAAAEGQDPRDLEAIVDEVAPAHPLDGADAFVHLSPEEDRLLSEDPLDPQG